MIHYFSLPGLSNCFLYLFKLIGSTWPSSGDGTSDMTRAHAATYRNEDFSLFLFFLIPPIVNPAPGGGEAGRLPFLWGRVLFIGVEE